MAITRPAQLNSFLSQAPDGARVADSAKSALLTKEVEEGEMTQISLRISKADLAEIDAAAKRLRLPRASLLRVAAFKYIRAETV